MRKRVKTKSTEKKKKASLGSKFDTGKAPVFQLLHQFPKAIEYISLISEHGHNKYGSSKNSENWDNWKHVEDKKFRYEQAMARHMLKKSDHLDDDSGFLSIGHTAWNALAILETLLEKNELVIVIK